MQRLGNTGLRVSALRSETLAQGRDTLDDGCAAQLKTFLEAGDNVIDTSPTYGEERAQQVLGALISRGDNRVISRDNLVIASKPGVLRRNDHSFVRVSHPAMLGSLGASLRELGTDHVSSWML